MSRQATTSRLALFTASLTCLLVMTACPKPQPTTNALVNTQAAVRLPVEEQLQMPTPGHDIDVETGIVEVTLVRTTAELGRFSDSLPPEISLESSMLLYIGRDRNYRDELGKAKKLLIVDAPARDIYSPGITVTSSDMHTVISMLFERPSHCGGQAVEGKAGAPDTTVVEPGDAADEADPTKGDEAGKGGPAIPGKRQKGESEDEPGREGTPRKDGKLNPRDAQLQSLAEGTEGADGPKEEAQADDQNTLRLFVVPSLPDPVQVSVETLPCPKS